jgi:hypothetical protein
LDEVTAIEAGFARLDHIMPGCSEA